MRISIVTCVVAIFAWLAVSPAAAQSPAVSQEAGGQTAAAGSPLVDRIDPQRLRQIRGERTRQLVLGAGLMAAGGVVGFSRNEWTIDEGIFGVAIAAVGVAALVEPLTWRDLDVRMSGSGLALEW